MLVYKISKTIYVNERNGTVSGLYGGRWNPKGINLLYTAGSTSLACLEYLVPNYHLMAGKSITLSIIRLADEVEIEEILIADLPKDWQTKEFMPLSTQKIGLDFFRQSKSYMLKVPSAIVPNEYNYLLNPMHPDHGKTKIHQ